MIIVMVIECKYFWRVRIAPENPCLVS